VESRPASSCKLVKNLLDKKGLGPHGRAAEAKAPLGEGLVDVCEGQPGQAMGPDKIRQNLVESGCCCCWEGDDLSEEPGLGGYEDLEDLDSLEKSREAAASPGPDGCPDTCQDSVPCGLH
jgi:hypothetical protein